MDEIKIKVDDDSDEFNCKILFVDTLYLKSGTTIIGKNKLLLPYPTISIGKIEVATQIKTRDEINSTMYHEFTHLIGFHHYQPIAYQSLFNPGQRKLVGIPPNETWVPSFTDFSSLDKAAIRIMYDADVAIDPGMTKKKFYRKIEEARKNMVK